MSTPKGMRIIAGASAVAYLQYTNALTNIAIKNGFMPVILPVVSSTDTFVEKAGEEVLGQMYTFQDKGNRDLCLIPEATAVIVEEYKRSWQKILPKPVKLFYLTRCYRYERPQAGRYREFTQFGVEVLGDTSDDNVDLIGLAEEMLGVVLDMDDVSFAANVKRGLDYYVEDGFEFSCESLGAQKQILGGGRYDCGIGFAIGVDRVLLAADRYA